MDSTKENEYPYPNKRSCKSRLEFIFCLMNLIFMHRFIFIYFLYSPCEECIKLRIKLIKAEARIEFLQARCFEQSVKLKERAALLRKQDEQINKKQRWLNVISK